MNQPLSYAALLVRYPNFARLYLAQTISLLGDWFNLIALLALLRETGHDSPEYTGALYIVKLLPNFLMSMPSGVVADRFNRRRIMLASDILRFMLVLGLFSAILVPGKAFIVIFTLTALQIAASAFFEPARTASLPDLVGPRDLVTANALGAMSWSIMFTLGAGLGGVVTEFLGWRWALVLDSSTFLISASLLLGLKLPTPKRAVIPIGNTRDLILKYTGLGEFALGLRFLKSRPDITALMFLKSGWTLGGGIVLLLTLYGQERYHFGFGPDLGVAILLVSRAIGTGIGPVLLRKWGGEDTAKIRRLIRFGYFTGAAFYLAFSQTNWSFLACFLIIGAHIGGSTVWVGSTVLLQKALPEEFRGRVFALELGFATLVTCSSIFTFSMIRKYNILPLEHLAFLVGSVLLLPGLFWSERLYARLVNKVIR